MTIMQETIVLSIATVKAKVPDLLLDNRLVRLENEDQFPGARGEA
jgi:hypothetical protein